MTGGVLTTGGVGAVVGAAPPVPVLVSLPVVVAGLVVVTLAGFVVVVRSSSWSTRWSSYRWCSVVVSELAPLGQRSLASVVILLAPALSIWTRVALTPVSWLTSSEKLVKAV